MCVHFSNCICYIELGQGELSLWYTCNNQSEPEALLLVSLVKHIHHVSNYQARAEPQVWTNSYFLDFSYEDKLSEFISNISLPLWGIGDGHFQKIVTC